MTDEEVNVEIARLEKWVFHKGKGKWNEDCWKHPDGRLEEATPHYCGGAEWSKMLAVLLEDSGEVAFVATDANGGPSKQKTWTRKQVTSALARAYMARLREDEGVRND